MGSCEADQVKVIPLVEKGVATKFTGVLGGRVYAVDTDSVVEESEVFPARSNA